MVPGVQGYVKEQLVGLFSLVLGQYLSYLVLITPEGPSYLMIKESGPKVGPKDNVYSGFWALIP